MQVFQRLQKLNITVSHQTVIKTINELSQGHDKETKDWCEQLKEFIVVRSIYILKIA